MNIALLGTRGIPACYGGFETFAEQLSTRLAKKGHEVTVYCCKPYSNCDDKVYEGVKRVVLPTVRKKSFEKLLFSVLSLLHVSFKKVDVVFMLGVSASAFCLIPRIFGKKVAINIDGLEWQRKKWSRVVSWHLKLSERMAGIAASAVVTDAKWIKRYYREKYGKHSFYLAYGADIIRHLPGNTLKEFGLIPNEYILFVSRFDPENNPLLVREAFDAIESPTKKLVMVGDAPFADDYIRKVRDTSNPNIIFTGYQFGDSYNELRSNAYFYIQATEIGGTHPALVEAMAAGNCVLANDVPEHREVLRDAGIYYKGKRELKEKIMMLMENEDLVKEKGIAALRIAEEEYSWESIVEGYEKMFEGLVAKRRRI